VSFISRSIAHIIDALLVTTGLPYFCSTVSMISSVRKFEQLINIASVAGRTTSSTSASMRSRVMVECASVASPCIASTSKPSALRYCLSRSFNHGA
jgi:hypothetical protein